MMQIDGTGITTSLSKLSIHDVLISQFDQLDKFYIIQGNEFQDTTSKKKKRYEEEIRLSKGQK